MDFEVIIVGGGPAGAFTAYKLAQSNLDVLLIEKEQLPRYKSCGGAVSFKTRELLNELNWETAVEDEITNITFSCNLNSPVSVSSEQPFVQLVMRDTFDQLLISEATKAGAQLIEGGEVIDINCTTDLVEVYTSENKFNSRLIVGADGYNSLVADQLDLNPKTNKAVGLEKEIKVNKTKLKEHKGQIKLDYGIIPKGYSWIFPKANHLSVGIATYQHGHNLKQKLTAFLKQEGYTDYQTLHFSGQLLPIWKEPAQLNTTQGLIIGDAAGLVNPLSGEGIYYALKSGQLASQAIIKKIKNDQSLNTYTNNIQQGLVPKFKAAKLLTKPFFLFPQQLHGILADKSWLLEKFLQVISGNQTYNSLHKSFLAEVPFLNN